MLHSGLTKHLPITLGQALVIVSFVVLLLWIPLREVPGIGTISNARRHRRRRPTPSSRCSSQPDALVAAGRC